MLARGGRRERVWQLTYAVGLLGVVGIGWASNIAVAIGAVLAWGLGGGANWVIAAERMAALGPDRYMARLSAIDQVAMIVAMTSAVVLLAVWLELGGTLGVGVVGLAGLGAVGWVGLQPRSVPARTGARPTAA